MNRAFKHINPAIYVPLQGPSELGGSDKLVHWDRSDALANITVPTLLIGARRDTIDSDHLARMADTLPKGRYLLCPQGSHLAMYDDQQVYFDGIVQFVRDVAAGGSSSIDNARKFGRLRKHVSQGVKH